MRISYQFAIVVILCITTIAATCRKNCVSANYSFGITVKAYPDRDSIYVGDSLWLEINAPVTLLDHITNKEITYSGSDNLGTVVTLLNLLSNGIDSGAINDFNIQIFTGSEYTNSINPFSNKVLLCKEDSGYYKLRILFTAKRTGDYVLTISNANNVFTNSNKCATAFYEVNFTSTNQHFYYLPLWRPDLTVDETGKKKVYYFKVY